MRDKIAVKFPGPPSSLTPLQRFLKWSVSGARTRTISPFSDLTVANWVEDRIKDGTTDGLRAAMLVDPANARLAAHFGNGARQSFCRKRDRSKRSSTSA